MPEYNERKLLRGLQALSGIDPAPEATEQALRNARETVDRLPKVPFMTQNRGLLRPPRLFFAAAAAVLIIIGLTAATVVIWQSRSEKQVPPTAILQDDPAEGDRQIAQPDVPDPQEPQVNPEIELELKHIFALAQAQDVQGLIGVLNKGSFAGKLVAASYLMVFGDERAIAPLEDLSSEWYRGQEANPFAAAASQIRRRLAQEEEPTTVPPSETQAGDSSYVESPAAVTIDDAEAAGAFKTIVQVHSVKEEKQSDGTITTSRIWIRLPDCIREEDPEAGRVIIDNGVQRLTLEPLSKEARFSETFKDVQPPGNHWLLGQIEALRGRGDDDLELTKIENESTPKTFVYAIEAEEAQGKVWIEAAGMLPVKAEAELKSDQNSEGPQFVSISFDYGPISDEVFALKIPDDYVQLTPKEAGAFSGHVVDQSGNPVAGATVSVKAPGLPNRKPLTGITDAQGAFNLKLPANLNALHSPVVIWAVVPNRPELVGWTLLRSELDKERHASLGGEVPGGPGVIHVSPEYKITRDAEGTTWTAAWCMGASDIIVVMEPAGRIVGKVTDYSDLGVAGAAVDVQFTIEAESGGHIYPYDTFWSVETLTDSEGNYGVGYLPRLWKFCSWHVQAVAEGFVTERATFRSDDALDVMTVDMKMHRAGVTVRGVLRDNYGTPLSNRAVYATVDGKRYFTCNTRSDAEGRFELKGCPDAPGLGIYTELSHNPFQSGTAERKLFVHYQDLTAEVAYEAGRTDYELELVVILPELTIEVAVVDSEGHPLPYYPVEIRADDDISTQWKVEQGFFTFTDQSGFCRITEVPTARGLRVVLSGQYAMAFYRGLSVLQRETLKEFMELYRNKYKWTEVPVELEPGRKEYYIRATVSAN